MERRHAILMKIAHTKSSYKYSMKGTSAKVKDIKPIMLKIKLIFIMRNIYMPMM